MWPLCKDPGVGLRGPLAEAQAAPRTLPSRPEPTVLCPPDPPVDRVPQRGPRSPRTTGRAWAVGEDAVGHTSAQQTRLFPGPQRLFQYLQLWGLRIYHPKIWLWETSVCHPKIVLFGVLLIWNWSF